jgi:predicted DNA-binding transcriptional regulator YafY
VTFSAPPASADTPTAPECLEVIVHAVQAHRRVRLRYSAQTGAVTDRVVDPYQVVNRAGRWYLVGYCHLRADQRVFRLDHVQRALELPETFTPAPIDALAAVEQSIAQTPWRWEFEVLAQAPLAELRARISATIATLRPQEGGVLLHGFADDLDWLAYVLAGLRCPLVIVRPPELRAHLLALADHIRAIAAQPAT